VTPIPAPHPAPALRRPELALPPWRYLPGQGPHPFRHPAGHLFTDGSAPQERPWRVEDWAGDGRWAHGLDLFDQRFYWESHEVIEALWHKVPRGHPVAGLAQGLIQAAASVLKRQLGEERAAQRLHERASRRLREAAEQLGPVSMGLHLPRTIVELERAAVEGGYPLLGRP
jgi:uncharacterized protein